MTHGVQNYKITKSQCPHIIVKLPTKSAVLIRMSLYILAAVITTESVTKLDDVNMGGSTLGQGWAPDSLVAPPPSFKS